MKEVLSASQFLSEQDLDSCLQKFNLNMCLMGYEFVDSGPDEPTFVSRKAPKGKCKFFD